MLAWSRESKDGETTRQQCLIQVLEVGLHVGGYLVVLVPERLSLVGDERVLLLAAAPLDLLLRMIRTVEIWRLTSVHSIIEGSWTIGETAHLA